MVLSKITADTMHYAIPYDKMAKGQKGQTMTYALLSNHHRIELI